METSLSVQSVALILKSWLKHMRENTPITQSEFGRQTVSRSNNARALGVMVLQPGYNNVSKFEQVSPLNRYGVFSAWPSRDLDKMAPLSTCCDQLRYNFLNFLLFSI